MLRNLPQLIRDQTLYSWCGLAHTWNGLGARSTSLQLFGSPSAATMHDFPAHLTTLHEHTAGQLGDSRTLALNHTLLGYFLPLASATLVSTVLRRVHEGAMPELKMKLGITASRIGGHHPLKGCACCFDDDEASVGFAYWHVAHQYPSVMVCQRHQRPLMVAWDPVTPVHRRGWILPRGGLRRQWIEISIDDPTHMDRLLRLAAFSDRFGELAPGALDNTVLAKTYQTALRCMGLATANGNLRLAALIEVTRRHYRGIEAIPGFEALQAVTRDWPGLVGALTRRKPRPGHPLKHLLLISMLFERWEEFWSVYKASEVLDPRPEGAVPDAPDNAAMDTFCDLVSVEKLSIRAASANVGISTTTGVKWARQLGLDYTPRAKAFLEPKKIAARKLLQGGRDLVEVADATGVSRITISRLLSSEPELEDAWKTARFLSHRKQVRRQFQQCINQNSSLPVKKIRRIPGNGYMWLYRNDRGWLRNHLPAIWRPAFPKPGRGIRS